MSEAQEAKTRIKHENTVRLTGRATGDPELRYSSESLAVAKVRIAVHEDRRGTEFVSLVAFGDTAEALAEGVHKADNLTVAGRLHTSTWDAKDGSGKRSRTEVIADSFTKH
jgi:single-strand DNA-binding protein